jgi:hypothetical protein
MCAEHPRRVVVVADGDPPAPHDPASQKLVAAVSGAHVLVAAPASAVPGERWVVDVEAREAQARGRADAWAATIATHASAVETEVGDPSPRLALADARRSFRPHAVVAGAPPVRAAPPRPWPRLARAAVMAVAPPPPRDTRAARA